MAAAVAALLLPGTALAARTHRVKTPAETLWYAQLKGTKGFSVNLTVESGRTPRVSAERDRSKRTIQAVTYSIHRRVIGPDGALHLEFGDGDRFVAHFVARSAQHLRPSRGCQGAQTVLEDGAWVGTFEFRGEGGFTQVHAHRARGWIIRKPAQTCPKGANRPIQLEPEATTEEAKTLGLIAGTTSAATVFHATRREEGSTEAGEGKATFFAQAERRVGGVGIVSSALTFAAPASTFTTPNAVSPGSEVMLTPPAPFSGSGTFHLQGPSSASWTGDLAVELPAFGRVPLTGPQIAAGTCEGTHCTLTLPPALRPYGRAPFTVSPVGTEAAS